MFVRCSVLFIRPGRVVGSWHCTVFARRTGLRTIAALGCIMLVFLRGHTDWYSFDYCVCRSHSDGCFGYAIVAGMVGTTLQLGDEPYSPGPSHA